MEKIYIFMYYIIWTSPTEDARSSSFSPPHPYLFFMCVYNNQLSQVYKYIESVHFVQSTSDGEHLLDSAFFFLYFISLDDRRDQKVLSRFPFSCRGRKILDRLETPTRAALGFSHVVYYLTRTKK